MNYNDELEALLIKNREDIKKIEYIKQELGKDTLVKEVEGYKTRLLEMKKEMEILKNENAASSKIINTLKNENEKIKFALYDIFYKERTKVVEEYLLKNKTINRKSNLNYVKELNSLTNFFEKESINNVNLIKNNSSQEYNNLRVKIGKLKEETEIFVQQEKLALEKKQAELDKKIEIDLKKIGNKPISQVDISNKIENLNFEFSLGNKISNVIGMIFIMLGVLYGAKISYDMFSFVFTNEVKTVIMFTVGLLLLVIGEFFNRKEVNTFSVGMTSGGIGVLYLSTGIVHFVFGDVFSPLTTIVLIGLISIASLLLALRYDSKVIAIFAFIGGYLPLIDFRFEQNFIIGGILYLSVLNTMALSLGIYKDWKITKYLSFILNLLVNTSLISIIIRYEYWHFSLSLIYITINYIVFIGTAILYPIKNKVKIDNLNKYLVVLHTLVHSVLAFKIFFADVKNYVGYCFLILCFVYFAFGKFLEKVTDNNLRLIDWFYLVALIFSLVAIPVQFGESYIVFSLSIEGAVLFCYGVLTEEKRYKIAGALTFLLLQLALVISYGVPYFIDNLQAFMALVAFITVIVAYYLKFKNRLYLLNSKNINFTIYKYFVIFNIYTFLFINLSDVLFSVNKLYSESIIISMAILIGIIIFNIKFLLDRILTLIIGTIAMILIFILIFTVPGTDSFFKNIMATVIFQGFGVFSFQYFIRNFIKKQDYVITVSNLFVIFVIIFSLPITLDYNYPQLVISLIVLIFGVIGLVYGFMKKYSTLRKTSLGLIYFAVIKLFIFDFQVNSSIERVISYFIFGIVLIGISFVYQKFSKSMLVDIENLNVNKDLLKKLIEDNSTIVSKKKSNKIFKADKNSLVDKDKGKENEK